MPLDLIVVTNNIYKRKQKIDLVKVFNEEKIIEKKLKIKKTNKFKYYFCECVLYRKKQ